MTPFDHVLRSIAAGGTKLIALIALGVTGTASAAYIGMNDEPSDSEVRVAQATEDDTNAEIEARFDESAEAGTSSDDTEAADTEDDTSWEEGAVVSEERARQLLDEIYKGDYRAAFVDQNPELFLKHIADDFRSVAADGSSLDANALRQFMEQRFQNHVRTIEHNVTIEDVDVRDDGTVSAVVTLYTLEEFEKANGDGNYLLTTVATYRDDWQERDGFWYEIRGDQLRSQTITSLRP